MTGLADVSLVLETANEKPGRRIRMTDVVDAWRRQTRADRILEWLVVSPVEPAPEVRRRFDGLPARFLVRPDLRYYQQKNAGLTEAAAPYAALADADALPDADWLERALEAIEQADPRVALITGRSRYLPGPFTREMAIAHMPNQSDQAQDTTHFLAHNVIFRCGIVRSLGFFQAGENRLGPDTNLAGRLIAANYRLRYDPSLRVTHNSHETLASLYRTCLLTGYEFGQFDRRAGSRDGRGRLTDFVGRVRLLLSRLRQDRRSVQIPIWRLPLSAFFFAAYSATFARGHGLALHGKPKP
jgi:hypothetical protein